MSLSGAGGWRRRSTPPARAPANCVRRPQDPHRTPTAQISTRHDRLPGEQLKGNGPAWLTTPSSSHPPRHRLPKHKHIAPEANFLQSLPRFRSGKKTVAPLDDTLDVENGRLGNGRPNSFFGGEAEEFDGDDRWCRRATMGDPLFKNPPFLRKNVTSDGGKPAFT